MREMNKSFNTSENNICKFYRRRNYRKIKELFEKRNRNKIENLTSNKKVYFDMINTIEKSEKNEFVNELFHSLQFLCKSNINLLFLRNLA